MSTIPQSINKIIHSKKTGCPQGRKVEKSVIIQGFFGVKRGLSTIPQHPTTNTTIYSLKIYIKMGQRKPAPCVGE